MIQPPDQNDDIVKGEENMCQLPTPPHQAFVEGIDTNAESLQVESSVSLLIGLCWQQDRLCTHAGWLWAGCLFCVLETDAGTPEHSHSVF